MARKSLLGGSARTDSSSSVVTLAIAKCETTLPWTGGLGFPKGATVGEVWQVQSGKLPSC